MRRLLFTILWLASFAQAQSLKHIIVIVKENRSFDHYFGQFPGVTGGPIISYNCVGSQGGCSNGTLDVIQADPTKPDGDCGHYFVNSTADYNDGAMNKFNQNCMGATDWAKQYGQATIPTYWSYATNYGLADHMFASAMGPSYPNHLYIIAATSNEARDNPQMLVGRPPNGVGGNQWTCDSFHYGRCTGDGKTLCSTNSDCSGNGTCQIDSPTGTCSVGGAACTLDTDCASGYCTNGNVYQGNFYGIDIKGGTGQEMFPGVCSNHRTVGCNSICTGVGDCSVTVDCNVSSPTNECNIADPICTGLSDVCDASTKQFLSAGRGSACPNVTTIADRMDQAGITWGLYYSTGNVDGTSQIWNPIGYVQHLRYGNDWNNNVHPDSQFVSDANACTSDSNCPLPSVVWVNGSGTISEHPPQLVADGEAWTATQVNAIMNNNYLWSNSTILITWDDFGGFADHLPPQQDSIGWTNGIRVPLLCVGRFCKNTITTSVFTPASILKCIESTFDLNALIVGVDGAAQDVCFPPGGMMSLSQNNPYPGGITTTTVTSSLNPSVFGQSVTFTATITAKGSGTPTGTVTFSDGKNSLGTVPLNSGTAMLQVSTLTAGAHTINAVYSGDSTFSSSTGTLQQTVNQASSTLTLTSSLNPSGLGQPVTFTATILPQYGGQATGTVTFYDGNSTLGMSSVTGNAGTLTTTGLTIGTHSITATYGGDMNVSGSSSSPLSQVVNKATTSTVLTSSVNPSNFGKPVMFLATVSSSTNLITGSVEFLNGTTVLGIVTLMSDSAEYTTSKLPLGPNVITAVYSGDANNNGSTSAPLNQVVLDPTTTTLTSSPNPSNYGQTVGFTATVSSSLGAPPNGEKVTFKEGSTVLGTGTLGNGVANFSTLTLAVGTAMVTAVYGGDSQFATSTSKPVKQIVNKAATTTILVSSQNPSKFGQLVTFTATVVPQFSGTPTGKVVFKDGSTTLRTVALNNGVASYMTSSLAKGSHQITANYQGSADFTTSSGTLTQVVQ